MKQLRFFGVVVLLLLIATAAFAQPRPTKVVGAGLAAAAKAPFHVTAGSNITWHKDTTYILTGFFYVDSTASLTIQAGTVILGDSATQGTLIIRRGAKIWASGTRFSPIIFSSSKAPGQRKRGDWGGVVILGSAPTNKPTTTKVEGIDDGGEYGGDNANDTSGVFRYVRIEYPGVVISLNNEINGLTMGGVGKGTQIEYVQVSYSNDDGFEWFGGNVDAKYLVSYGSLDDDFDTDFGYSGRIQFAFSKKDLNAWDAAGQTNGFESDNDGTPTTQTPLTAPVFSNVTLIGPQADTNVALPAGHKFEYGAVIRRNTRLSFHNSVIMGFPFGLSLRNDSTAAYALQGNLQIRNVSLQARTNVLNTSSVAGGVGFNFATFFGTSEWKNQGTTPRQLSAIGLINPFATIPDPRPAQNSEADTAGTDFTSTQLAGGWFTAVSYRGAFNPDLPLDQQWTADWTNFIPQNTVYDGSVSNFIVVDGMKDAFYGTLTGPLDGYIQMRSSAYNNNGAPKSDADLSAKVWTAWDSTWFYFYEEVMDDTISGNGVNSYQDDGLELKFDAQAKDSVANTIFGVNLTILSGSGSDSLSSSGIPELARMYSRKIITGGYALELAIKWSAIGTTEKVSVAVDSVFGLAINNHDNDGNLSIGGGRQASVQWAAVMDDAVWNTPKYLGTVMFLSGNKLLFDDKNNMTGRTNPYKYDGTDIPLSVKIAGQGIPTEYRIGQNYPNPFNPSTTIRYELPVSGLVTLKVYNVVGQEVSTLVNGMQEAGKYEARFDAVKLSSGVYFYTIRAGNYLQTKKMLLLK